MVRSMELQPGDLVLDLGSGRGETSIFLARYAGVRVIAVDLWTPASTLYQKLSRRGYRERIIPLNLDITGRLPLADAYFDAIFCMNSFSSSGEVSSSWSIFCATCAPAAKCA